MVLEGGWGRGALHEYLNHLFSSFSTEQFPGVGDPSIMVLQMTASFLGLKDNDEKKIEV